MSEVAYEEDKRATSRSMNSFVGKAKELGYTYQKDTKDTNQSQNKGPFETDSAFF